MIKHGNFIALGIMTFVVSWGGFVPVMAADLEHPCAGAPCPVEDVIESEGIRIIGDSDMPKALYIVPWKKPALPTLSNRLITSFVNDALSSINRESLAVQIKFNELIQSDAPVKAVK